MSSQDTATGVRPVSHSQLSRWLRCGESYRLEKIQRVNRRPGVWFPAGTAVHAAIERYLRGEGN